MPDSQQRLSLKSEEGSSQGKEDGQCGILIYDRYRSIWTSVGPYGQVLVRRF